MLGKAIEKAYNLDQSEDRWLFRNENKGVFLWIISVHTSNPNLGSLRALPLGERGLRPGVGLTQTAGFRDAARGLRKAVGPGSSSVEGQWGSSASPWGFVGSGASHTGIHQHHLVLTLPGKTGVGCCPWNPPQSSFPPLYSGDCIPRCPFTETLGGFLGASVQLSRSVVSDFATPMDCSTPGFPVLELAPTVLELAPTLGAYVHANFCVWGEEWRKPELWLCPSAKEEQRLTSGLAGVSSAHLGAVNNSDVGASLREMKKIHTSGVETRKVKANENTGYTWSWFSVCL